MSFENGLEAYNHKPKRTGGTRRGRCAIQTFPPDLGYKNYETNWNKIEFGKDLDKYKKVKVCPGRYRYIPKKGEHESTE